MKQPSSFDTHALIGLGIDHAKCGIIKFLIDKEGLDCFDENEHFYYWIFKSEKVLSDIYNFVKEGPYIFSHEGMDYDLNSFQGITQLVIDLKDVEKVDKIFSGPPNHAKREFMLRYSKKYKRLEYYTWFHGIEKNRKRDKYYIRHTKYNFFSIDERNNVRIYPNRKTVRYISNKSVMYFRGNDYYRNDDMNFYLKLNRRLLNLHLKSDFYDSDEGFLDRNQLLNHLPNEVFKGCNSMDELISKTTKKRPVPKILTSKMPGEEIVSMYRIVEYEEMDKIIKFLYEYHDFKDISMNYFNILYQYMCVRIGILVPDKKSKSFELAEEHKSKELFMVSKGSQEVRDYIRMLSTLGKKINLNIKGMKRLCFEHDELASRISSSTIPKIKVKRYYPTIQSGEGFVVERIEDKNRLVAESEIQKHCVKTYAMYINRGTCCIYSFLDKSDGRRYTLEVQVHKNPELKKQVFILNQIRGKFNSSPPVETLSRVVAVLKTANIYASTRDAAREGFVFPNSKNNENQRGMWVPINEENDFNNELPF